MLKRKGEKRGAETSVWGFCHQGVGNKSASGACVKDALWHKIMWKCPRTQRIWRKVRPRVSHVTTIALGGAADLVFVRYAGLIPFQRCCPWQPWKRWPHLVLLYLGTADLRQGFIRVLGSVGQNRNEEKAEFYVQGHRESPWLLPVPSILSSQRPAWC